jgi:hypothetical protein
MMKIVTNYGYSHERDYSKSQGGIKIPKSKFPRDVTYPFHD